MSAELDKKVHWLAKRISRAQREYSIFGEGDRVLVALSGGKDSLALLRVLADWGPRSGTGIEVGAVHVEVVGGVDRRGDLEAMAEAAGVPLFFTSFVADPVGPGPDGRETHPCFRCGRLRREALLRFAGEHGWNKVALGHHLDDDAETVLMNLLHQGTVKGLAPVRSYFGGEVTIVRPLIMAEEAELRAVARLLEAPLATCTCPDGRPEPPDSARQRAKAMLSSMGREARTAKRHLQRAGRDRGTDSS